MRRAKRQMREAMRRYWADASGKADWVRFELVSVIFGSGKGIAGGLEGRRGSTSGLAEEWSLSADSGTGSLLPDIPPQPPGSAGGGPGLLLKSIKLLSGL